MGLPWIFFADNDPAGATALSKITDPDTGNRLTHSSPRVVIAGAKAIEQLLLDSGYGDEIGSVAQDHGEEALSDADRLKYLTRNKGWVGEAVVTLALRNGKPIPSSVVDLANRIQTMLGTAAPGLGVATP